MKSLKNYEENFHFFERKNKFRKQKQNYLKNKNLCKDLFIDIPDIRDDEISINKKYKKLYKEEKFITLEENISIEEDDLIDTCKEEEESESKNNMYVIISPDQFFQDSNLFKENKDPNILILSNEKNIKENKNEKENNKILYLNLKEDQYMNMEENKSGKELNLESEKKYSQLRKEVITKINYLNNEEIIDLMVFLENIRPQAIEELSNDAMYINVEQFNDDTFQKVFEYLNNINIID